MVCTRSSTCYHCFGPTSKQRRTPVSTSTSTFSVPSSLHPSSDGLYFNETIYWGQAILSTRSLPIDQNTRLSPTPAQDHDAGVRPSTCPGTSIPPETRKSPLKGVLAVLLVQRHLPYPRTVMHLARAQIVSSRVWRPTLPPSALLPRLPLKVARPPILVRTLPLPGDLVRLL